MKKKLLFIIFTLISMIFLLGSIAEAKRFGGGSSFGSKKSYSSPYKKSAAPQKSFSQQKAAAANQQKKQQFSKRGGLMGMLGGLALGGLLGALFFGGAFEGFNFFDFLIIGGIIFAVFWFLKRKQTSAASRPAAAGAAGAYSGSSSAQQMHFDASQTETSLTNSSDLKTRINQHYNDSNDADFSEDLSASSSSQTQTELPDWFDQEEFLNGARSAYLMLQKAWDDSDLNAIKGLTTEHVYNEIQSQIVTQPPQGTTRILQLNAELIDFQELENQHEAAVMFDNLVAESDSQGNEGRAAQVRELWHFMRGKDSTAPTWYLDGIQQIEE